MPVCDQLVECLILPAMFRPATKCRVVTTFRASLYVNKAAGAIPAASTLLFGSPYVAIVCDQEGRGLVSRGREFPA